MKIPVNSNYLEFLTAAKAQNVKVSSRYIGVYISYSPRKKKPFWMARVQEYNKGKNKTLHSKRFPFTEEGERQAGEFYKTHKQQI